MRIGISRMSKPGAEADRVLTAARAHGFDGVQLKPAQYEQFVAAPQSFVDHYGPLASLVQGGLIVYPGGDPSRWMEKAEPVIGFAAAVRAEHICFCSNVYGTAASEEQVTAVEQALTGIGRRARDQGLAISIHNHVNSLVETEADIARLLERLDPSICGLTLDTAHAAKAGVADVSRLVERFAGHLINVHLKDIAPDGTFCALGQGTLAIEPILSALRAVRYDRWLIVDEETASMQTEQAFAIAADCLARHGLMAAATR